MKQVRPIVFIAAQFRPNDPTPLEVRDLTSRSGVPGIHFQSVISGTCGTNGVSGNLT